MDRQPLRVVLPGGSGQVGTILARYFHGRGDHVTILARVPHTAPWRVVLWDGVNQGDWAASLDGADLVINLAGRSVNCRYTPHNRREIKESRILSTCAIGEAIRKSSRPPKVWMNASTATIYRHAFDRGMDEASGEIGGAEPGAPSSWRFSIDVATSWEDAFFSSPAPATRKVALRSAMVMSPDRSGVFDALLQLVRFGLGGASGSGRQFVSWIHDQDFVQGIDYIFAHVDLDGPINASPNPLPNAGFMAAIRKAWGAHIGLPASRWMLECGAVLMRTETELILKSRRVVPGRLFAHGFRFGFPVWPEAAADLVRRWKAASAASRPAKG